MDWLEKMNLAIEYIEDNIIEDIDYRKIARIACCPNYHFQRMFSFITEISISEYIRRRRLTLAAFELQQSNISVTDAAQKYGYDSHAAFTRAFKDIHGISPTAARKSGAKLKAYPPMSFNISIIGGIEVNYRIETLSTFSVVGVKHTVSMEEAFDLVPKIWQQIGENENGNILLKLRNEVSSNQFSGVLGILSEGNWGKRNEFLYYTAVPCEKEAPMGMEKLIFQENQWVVFEVPTLEDMPRSWKALYEQWVPTSGYELADLPAIECYYPPGHNPQNELWIPIMKNRL